MANLGRVERFEGAPVADWIRLIHMHDDGHGCDALRLWDAIVTALVH